MTTTLAATLMPSNIAACTTMTTFVGRGGGLPGGRWNTFVFVVVQYPDQLTRRACALCLGI